MHGADVNKRYRKKVNQKGIPKRWVENLYSEMIDESKLPPSHKLWIIRRMDEILPKNNKKLLVAFHSIWTPDTHHFYPVTIREAVRWY